MQETDDVIRLSDFIKTFRANKSGTHFGLNHAYDLNAAACLKKFFKMTSDALFPADNE